MGTVRLPARSARRGAFERLDPAAGLAGSLGRAAAASRRWRAVSALNDSRLGRGLVMLVSLALLEVAVAWQPTWRVWVWSGMLLLSGGGAALCVIAGQRDYKSNYAWYAA